MTPPRKLLCFDAAYRGFPESITIRRTYPTDLSACGLFRLLDNLVLTDLSAKNLLSVNARLLEPSFALSSEA